MTITRGVKRTNKQRTGTKARSFFSEQKMNILVDVFRCFLIIFFAFSLKLRDNKVQGIQQQQNQYNWKKENIEEATEREWAGEEETTTRSYTTEEYGHRDLRHQSIQKPQTASEKRSSPPRSQLAKPPDHAPRVSHGNQDIAFRNLPQNDAPNSKPPGNMPNKGLQQTVKDTRGSSDVEPEKPNSSLAISIGWGSMIPKEVKKEQDDKFHRLMCIADCKMADLMVFNMKNKSESNPFLNIPLPGRPYTYNTLIDWCKQNCGSSYGWMIPVQEPKPTTTSTTTTTTTTTTTPPPTNLRASYKQEMPSFKTKNYKQSFYDFQPHLYEPSLFKPSHFPPSMWQQQPIYPTMPDHPILHFETKSPIFQQVHSALPTIFIPPMAMTKPNFFPFSNLMAGPPPSQPRSPPPPPPQILYRSRDSGDDHREIMPSMNSPGTIGMSFRLKGGPFFAGTILKRPLTGRSNVAPEYDLGVDTRQWNSGGKLKHEESVDPFTEESHETPNEDKNEEEESAVKAYEDSYQNEKDDDEEDDSDDVASTIFNIVREIYKLITHRGVRTLLKMFFCDEDSSAIVKHDVASRIHGVGRREGSHIGT